MKQKWQLESGEARADEFGTFEIPTYEARASLQKGMYVKVIFSFEGGGVERMWVEVLGGDSGGYVGSLISTPATVTEHVLSSGTVIRFEPRHVIDIEDPEAA